MPLLPAAFTSDRYATDVWARPPRAKASHRPTAAGPLRSLRFGPTELGADDVARGDKLLGWADRSADVSGAGLGRSLLRGKDAGGAPRMWWATCCTGSGREPVYAAATPPRSTAPAAPTATAVIRGSRRERCDGTLAACCP